MPTFSTPSTACHTAASVFSATVFGAAYAAPARTPPSGSGSALRSTLPFGVSGKRSSFIIRAGTMCDGRLCSRYACSSSTLSTSSPAA
ncbi:hypothetical protein YDYSG_24940 [Paenibacillus tyrfis]|nr:hypothetical protein YDYSG_24940 [Paenibacillus tyrfis]